MAQQFMWILIILSIWQQGWSSVTIPRHFYKFDPDKASTIGVHTVNGHDRYETGQVSLSSPMYFYGKNYNKILISKNGMITFGNQDDEDEPAVFPLSGEARIAPLWTRLNYGDETEVFYQNTTKVRSLRKAKRYMQSKFGCAQDFDPEIIITVTWYNMLGDSCLSTSVSRSRCECHLYSPQQHCECYYLYLDDYCECVRNHAPGECPCDPYFDRDDQGYCTCINDGRDKLGCHCNYDTAYYPRDLCSCYYYKPEDYWDCYCGMEYPGYSMDYCMCLSTRSDDDLCQCYNSNDPAYCECVIIGQYNPADCLCYPDYDVKYDDSNHCDCIVQYSQKFSEYVDAPVWTSNLMAEEFCFCNNQTTLNRCLCYDGSSIDDGYCQCLDNFETSFHDEGKDHTFIHRFCLCMSQKNDYAACSCESCPVSRKRELWYAEGQENLSDDFQLRALEEVSGYNTFQAVLIIGGNQTYVIFNYGSINLTPLDDGRYPATVGFDSGLNGNGPFFNHKYGWSHRIKRLRKRSNDGMSGRWFYRVDGTSVLQPGEC